MRESRESAVTFARVCTYPENENRALENRYTAVVPIEGTTHFTFPERFVSRARAMNRWIPVDRFPKNVARSALKRWIVRSLSPSRRDFVEMKRKWSFRAATSGGKRVFLFFSLFSDRSHSGISAVTQKIVVDTPEMSEIVNDRKAEVELFREARSTAEMRSTARDLCGQCVSSRVNGTADDKDG